MKYPKEQFEELKKAIKLLLEHTTLESWGGVHNMHYRIYSQYHKSLEHVWLYVKDGIVKYRHSIDDLDGWVKIIDSTYPFELYPNDCNDDHISTAMNRAIKG